MTMKHADIGDGSAMEQPDDNDQGAAPAAMAALVVDGSAFDRKRMRRELERTSLGLDLTEVTTLTELRDAIGLRKYDVIFVDYQLKDGTGLDAVDIIRATPLNLHTSAIMISRNRNANVVVEALKRGCCDYMTKDTMAPASLTRAVVNAVEKAKLATGLVEARKLQSDLDKALESFAKDCIADMKPALSLMLEEMGTATENRPNQNTTSKDHPDAQNLQSYGQTLLSFIEDIETYTTKIRHLNEAGKAASKTSLN